MKRWTRAKQATWCGSCSAVIDTGTPMFVIEAGTRQFRRCASCAGQPVNVEQLEAEDVRRDAQAREPEGRAIDGAARVRDGKLAASGEEP